MDAHLGKPCLRKTAAKGLHTAIAADQREHLVIGAHRAGDVVRSAMQADDCGVVIADAEARAEIAHGAEPRERCDLAAAQQRKELLRAAEKAGVAREHNGKDPAGRPGVYGGGDVLRRDGGAGLLAGTRHGVQHPARADQALCPPDGVADAVCLGVLASRADAGKIDFRFRTQTEALAEHGDGLRQVGACFRLRRAADHDKARARFFRGGRLFFKAAGRAAVLRDEPARLDAAEHGGVHIL